MQYGFRVIDAPEVLAAEYPIYRWRRVNVFDFAIETHANCPIDGTAMETIAALVSETLPEKIRVGCCPTCGLVGYIDQLSEADIDRYYAETWLKEDESLETARSIAREPPNERRTSIIASLHLPRDTPILEIGCGCGVTVHVLQSLGFTNIDATEHCTARAEAVRQVFGVNVTTEMPQKRYGLIVSQHVLEHCVDPVGLVRACAERQERGDWMIHSMPDFYGSRAFLGEPSIGVLMFLPHLWSFNPYAVSALTRQRYSMQASIWGMDLCAVCERMDDAGPAINCPDPVRRAITKLLHGLGLVDTLLVWQVNSDGAAWVPRHNAEAIQLVGRSDRVLAATQIHDGFITDAPIEIQFPGRVEMYLK